MKLFLLCIGLTLFITVPAHAQDTIQHTIPDSTKPVKTIQVTDSAAKDTMGRISPNTDSNTDSVQVKTAKDTISTISHSEPVKNGAAPPEAAAHAKDTAADYASRDTGKIVDIFEEMDKARQQQNNVIHQEHLTLDTSEEKQQVGMAMDSSSPVRPAAAEAGDSSVNDPKAAMPAGTLKPAQAPEKTTDSNATRQNSRPSTNEETVKKDTIQSIFTLPAPVVTHSDADSGAGKVARSNDTIYNSAADTTTATQQDSNKAAVNDNLNKLFEATADSAAKDSQAVGQRTDSLLTRVPAPAVQTGNKATDTDTLSQAAVNKPVSMPDSSSDPNNPGARQTDKDKNDPAPQAVTAKDTAATGNGLSDHPDTADSTDSILQAKNTPFTELFQPYRAFDKETQISSTTSLTILQQNVDYKTSADFTTEYQRTGEKEGNFIFDVSVIKLNTEVETMGVQLKYDSNQRSDSTSTFAKPLFDIVGKKTYLQVDSTGKITAVDNTELGRQVNSVLSGLSLSGGDFEVGSNFGLLMSKSGPPQIGEQWSDTVNNGGNNRITTYKIQSILDGDMMVSISGTVNQTGVINSDGAVFKTHFTGTQKGKMYVDQETLLVKSRDLTLNMKGTVDYNGQALPASAVSKIKEKVTGD